MSQLFKKFIKKLTWQDYLLIVIIILFLGLQMSLINSYKQLPAPLYGGDLYCQLGAVNHVKHGGNPLVNFRNSDPISNYFPLYTIIVGGSSYLFNTNPMSTMFFYSYIFTALALISLYLLGYFLFKNKTIALFVPLIYFLLHPFKIIIKYTYFSYLLIFPAFFLFLYLTFSSQKKKYLFALVTGIMYGLGSLSHGIIFPVLSIFMILIFFYLFIWKYLEKKKKITFNKRLWKKDLKENIIILALIFIPGLIIAQLYWLPIIKNTLFGQETSNSATLLNMNVPSSYNPFIDFFKKIFDFKNLFNSFVTILFLISIPLLSAIKKYNEATKYIILTSIGAIFSIFSLLILSGITNINLNTVLLKIIHHFWVPLAITLLSSFSLLVIFKVTKKKRKKLSLIIAIIMIVFFLVGNLAAYQDYKNNKWHQAGKKPLSPHLNEIANYIKSNTNVNDAILTNKELGFSINGLTGRKLVAQPVGHKNLLYDFNARERDLALMLYGNGSTPRRDLFKKYNVQYFYWDNYWIESEFHFNEKGQIVGLFDPLELLNTEKNKKILTKFNVTYSEEYLELNPNKRGNVQKYDVLLVKPRFDLTHPWHPSLDNFLTLEKEIKRRGQTVVKLYEVKNE